MKYRFLWACLVAVAIAAAAACGGSSPTSATNVTTPGTPGSATGKLTISMKDSPFSDAKALLVTISKVTAHMADGTSWTTLPFTGGATSRTCDLKRLTNTTDVLGTGTLTAGHYTQIRLTVASATLYFDNATTGDVCGATMTTPLGLKAEVKIPSGEIKLNHQFEVPAGGTTSILLDFDGDKSIKLHGNGDYQMSPPVISVVSTQTQSSGS